MKVLSIAALMLATASPALAAPSVEVMCFWTSGGEAAALSALCDKVVGEGVPRTDVPVAGGGGDQAKTALEARIAAGNPPAAMLMPGQTFIDWADEVFLGNVDALAAAQGWDAALPQTGKDFTKVDGPCVSVPANLHRTDMIWASKAAFDKIGAAYPITSEELNALAPKALAAGIIPLAHGGQAWQEAHMSEAVALGVGGAEFCRKALIDLGDATPRGPEMVAVVVQMATLRGMAGANFPGRDGNLASAMVINGEAAMQIMGDGAKGEFTNARKMPGDDHACIRAPKATGDGFVHRVNALSLFTLTDPDLVKGQDALACAILDPAIQVAFSQARGAIPVRTDIDLSAMDACAQATSASLAANDAGGTAVPTFAGTHAANAAVAGAATVAITAFVNSGQTPEAAATDLADAIAAAR